ncbi:uncharacterized protein BJ212DRAFT_1302793 [Suillus subaureus]|uniref:Crinkler effector protein N-terminal domain-containing protein n=1 Tax=Suillus subaureus TaxID=48587 RepID=A0A9P7E1Q1_9AGAM|nr:uncharacterized protein BJ212DRAFT_1302793 [Suillus subaureus]KAG1808892.1 hypothetical protein BJ212DRAFT_1302793 [Suillus subaureus]
MESHVKLTCVILGNEPNPTVFQINIACMDTVSDLKKLIKERHPVFHNIASSTLQLCKVDLLVDNTLECKLNKLELDPKKWLSPVDAMLKVFDSPPLLKHLHIVIQPPPALRLAPSPPASNLPIRLNCTILGYDFNCIIFQIRIVQMNTVNDLKELIKERNPVFHNIAASTLWLWKVALSDDEKLEHNLNKLELDPKKSLSAMDAMLEVFDSPPQHKHLHIVVQPPPAFLLEHDIDLRATTINDTTYLTNGDTQYKGFCYAIIKVKNKLGSTATKPHMQALLHTAGIMITRVTTWMLLNKKQRVDLICLWDLSDDSMNTDDLDEPNIPGAGPQAEVEFTFRDIDESFEGSSKSGDQTSGERLILNGASDFINQYPESSWTYGKGYTFLNLFNSDENSMYHAKNPYYPFSNQKD